MSTTTVTTGAFKSVTVEEILRAVEAVAKLPIPNKWTLVSPSGEMWQGTVEQLTPILFRSHLLMKAGATTALAIPRATTQQGAGE